MVKPAKITICLWYDGDAEDAPAEVAEDGVVARSSLEVVNWGLDRIERLRRSRAEKREVWERKWQMWSVLGISLANMTITAARALRKQS